MAADYSPIGAAACKLAVRKPGHGRNANRSGPFFPVFERVVRLFVHLPLVAQHLAVELVDHEVDRGVQIVLLAFAVRITSYNVCYTKLLRIRLKPLEVFGRLGCSPCFDIN